MISSKMYRAVFGTFVAALVVGLLVGCASGDKAKMAELVANPATMGVKPAWSTAIGSVSYPLDIRVVGDNIYVADSAGTVLAMDGRTGGSSWRTEVKSRLTAGVGSDGRYVAVVNRDNELVALDGGKELWRQKLAAVTLTAPLVAGERIFILSADRSLAAFDALTGKRLWQQQRPGESLVLQQSGVLTAVGDTLLAGLGGRVAGLNPQTGVSKWETQVANSRGTNEVERLVDVIAGVARSGDQVCVRSFQSAVACIDTTRGGLVWSKNAIGSTGIGGDANVIYGTESDGTVVAWRRSDGDKLWSSDQLKFRSLTAPLLVGPAIVVGDAAGYVHFLSTQNGTTLNRVATDGSAVVAGPVIFRNTIVVVTKRGGVFGFRPE